MQAAQLEDPRGANVPARQSSHSAAPAEAAIVPTAQSVQDVEPVLSAYLPLTHCVQASI
jgi:hypothetical protein